MHYYNHLVKMNNLRESGGRLGLSGLVVRYNLAYLFLRPFTLRLLGKNPYRGEKKLFYTVLTDGYDRLNEITPKVENWDYICFTDNKNLTSDTWEVRLLENKLGLDPIRLSRHYKINNHLVDSGYFLSVYVDANILIRGNLDSFVFQALPPGSSCGVLLHPFLSSLREEKEQCIRLGKDDAQLLQDQYDYYTREQGFDDRFPHVNARLIIRQRGDERVRRLMETWFKQLVDWSCRDQMAFNYSLSMQADLALTYIPYWLFRRYFKKMDHR